MVVHPDDLDFAYFACTIGMTFQVSAQLVVEANRRVVLGQALMSNLAIFALVINIIAGRVGRDLDGRRRFRPNFRVIRATVREYDMAGRWRPAP